MQIVEPIKVTLTPDQLTEFLNGKSIQSVTEGIVCSKCGDPITITFIMSPPTIHVNEAKFHQDISMLSGFPLALPDKKQN